MDRCANVSSGDGDDQRANWKRPTWYRIASFRVCKPSLLCRSMAREGAAVNLYQRIRVAPWLAHKIFHGFFVYVRHTRCRTAVVRTCEILCPRSNSFLFCSRNNIKRLTYISSVARNSIRINDEAKLSPSPT